jgi:aspartate-semialdehyde dehydrogenase
VKLREARPLAELEEIIASANEWVTVIPNDRSETISRLSPMAISGSLKIAVGRLHTLRMGPDYLGLFTIGDQLLWGAAEPLRRFLRILVSR